jgi:hypothetical protein
VHKADGGEATDDQHGDDGADRQGDQRLPSGLLPQQLRIQFVSGEQEQEAQRQSGEEFDVAGVREAQYVRPDQHAADDQEQHLGWAARHQTGKIGARAAMDITSSSEPRELGLTGRPGRRPTDESAAAADTSRCAGDERRHGSSWPQPRPVESEATAITAATPRQGVAGPRRCRGARSG